MIRKGESATIFQGKLLLEDGRTFRHEDCRFELGSSLSFWSEEVSSPVPPKHHHRKKNHMDPISTEPPAEHAPEPEKAVETPPVSHETAPALPVSAGEETSLAGAVGAAAFIKDNPWAPLVMVVLAALAVLGGRQGWKFYSTRAAQNHELEMKKLELQAQAQQTPTQQPPPCVMKQAENDARLAALDAKFSSIESRVKALESAAEEIDFDPSEAFDELDKRLKKIEKAKSTPTAKPATASKEKA